MNRPALNELIKKVNKKEIQCIIVKDFSRFARNYIELGKYIEYIFPKMNVQFISINDKYDSNIFLNINSLEISFKNILYDLYSKDYSLKMKALNNSKKRCIYGYTKDDTIDTEAANIVKKIFNFALEEKNNVEIAKILNFENIVTPKDYKKCIQNKNHSNFWNPNMISSILKNERYTGKNGIIENKIFELVNKNKKNDVKLIENKKFHIFKGIIRCPYCKHMLYHKTNCFYCRTPKLIDNDLCFKGYIQENDIKESVFNTVIIFKDLAYKRIAVSNNNISNLNAEIYKKYRLNEITQEEYVLKKSRILIKSENLKNQAEQKRLQKPAELTKDDIQQFIDTIYVYEKNKIEIILK